MLFLPFLFRVLLLLYAKRVCHYCSSFSSSLCFASVIFSMRCPSCSRVFGSLKSLASHIRSDHKHLVLDDMMVSSLKLQKCPRCLRVWERVAMHRASTARCFPSSSPVYLPPPGQSSSLASLSSFSGSSSYSSSSSSVILKGGGRRAASGASSVSFSSSSLSSSQLSSAPIKIRGGGKGPRSSSHSTSSSLPSLLPSSTRLPHLSSRVAAPSSMDAAGLFEGASPISRSVLTRGLVDLELSSPPPRKGTSLPSPPSLSGSELPSPVVISPLRGDLPISPSSPPASVTLAEALSSFPPSLRPLSATTPVSMVRRLRVPSSISSGSLFS